VATFVSAAPNTQHGFMGFGFTLHARGKEQWMIVRLVMPGGPADRAGIKQGDMITLMNGNPIAFTDPVSVLDDFANRRPGERVSFAIVRNQKPIAATVIVGEMSPQDYERWKRTRAALRP
jgi:S1-C subfamily serine protease